MAIREGRQSIANCHSFFIPKVAAWMSNDNVSFRPSGAGRFGWGAFPGLRPPRRTPSGAIFVHSLREEMQALTHLWLEELDQEPVLSAGFPYGIAMLLYRGLDRSFVSAV
jgi:hypothetical protein